MLWLASLPPIQQCHEMQTSSINKVYHKLAIAALIYAAAIYFYKRIRCIGIAFLSFTRLKPVVILTDLGENYTFYWLDNHTLYHRQVDSALLAWGLFDAILSSEQPGPEAGVVPREGIEAVPPPVKRQRLVFDLVLHVQDTDVADLSSLAAELEPSEIRTCTLAHLLRSLNAVPGVAVSRGVHTGAHGGGFPSFYA
jgi:hypothetical protein